MYATFTEALDGAASIRAYNAQQRFCQLNEQQVALSQQAAFAGKIHTYLVEHRVHAMLPWTCHGLATESNGFAARQLGDSIILMHLLILQAYL